MTDDKVAQTNIGLSSALIGGAFGFVGIAIFASASYADKVAPGALVAGNWVTVAAVVLLILSIIFGGKGTLKPGSGPMNMFNLQACAGLIGVLFLLVASAIFAFNPKAAGPPSVSVPVFEARMHRLEVEQQTLAAELRAQRQHGQVASLRTASQTNANIVASRRKVH